MKHLRSIAAGCVFAICLCFSQYLPVKTIFIIFSAAIAIVERHTVFKIITNKFFLWSIPILWAIAYFFAQIYAVDYFNSKYGIFAENLNFAVQVRAGFIATVFLFSIYCLLLYGYFIVKLWKNQKQFANFSEASIHSFTCAFVFAFLVSLFPMADKYDTNILHLDAYEYSDCQTPENEMAIRKNDTTCFSFKPTGELEEYPRNKH